MTQIHIGCLVSIQRDIHKRYITIGREEEDFVVLGLDNNRRQKIASDKLKPCFQADDWVLHEPTNTIGRIISQNGRRPSYIVHCLKTGKMHSYPLKSLIYVPSPEFLWQKGSMHRAEDIRLYNLAHALQYWDRNTGALSAFSCDPLPHQIHLVHKLLSSGQYNWMIADDVGLGKTIEVGMLLWALTNKHKFRRIMIACPSGLTKQWKEELREKFGMEDFKIYGVDFHINEARDWRHYPMVIASMDRLKHDKHLPLLKQSKDWDIVIIDEAHKMTRRQNGMSFSYTKRFRLAQALREKTDNMLLLTATPHQGREDRFKALLELIRPDVQSQIRQIQIPADVLRGCIHRSRKSRVTDMQGNLLFKGQKSIPIPVDIGDKEREFDALLQDYLKRGYSAASGCLVGTRGYAIGFVMTIYRKLAASSYAAIAAALEKRKERLRDLYMPNKSSFSMGDLDDSFSEEDKESWALYSKIQEQYFFENEEALLDPLIEKANALSKNDVKFEHMMQYVIKEADENNEKVLIFSEYRNTQAHIVDRLSKKYGADQVVQIHGGMNIDEKRAAVASFNSNTRFMVSTEAGGEGINLHYHCHMMVNYDLPWNPMKLVQRIGRLYRYGQKKTVMTYNMHAPQTIDAEIVQGIYQRLENVVRDLSPIGEDYSDGLSNEIFGDIASLVDLKDIIRNMRNGCFDNPEPEIEEALEQAKRAKEKQDELLSTVGGFNVTNLKEQLLLNHEHLRAFIVPMLKRLGCEIRTENSDAHIVEVKLSKEVALEIKSKKTVYRLCFEQGYKKPGVDLVNKHNPLYNYLIGSIDNPKFKQKQGCIILDTGDCCGATALLQWQDDSDNIVREDLVAMFLRPDGTVYANPQAFSQWLKEENPRSSVAKFDAPKRSLFLNRLKEGIEEYFSDHQNEHVTCSASWLLSVYTVLKTDSEHQ